MADFHFTDADFFNGEGNNYKFSRAAAQNQMNVDTYGKKKPMRTSQSQYGPRKTINVLSISDIGSQAVTARPKGAVTDIHNRIGQDQIAEVVSDQGPEYAYGAARSIAPGDLLVRSATARGTGVLGAYGALNGAMNTYDPSAYPPPAPGSYRRTREVGKAYSGDNTGNPDPNFSSSSNNPRLTGFQWWTGANAIVHVATVEVWAMIDDIFQRHGYRVDSGAGYHKRKIAGKTTWSLHSFGVAVDINPKRNPDRKDGVVVSDMDAAMVQEIRNIRTTGGVKAVSWGGDWTGGYVDPMHFQMSALPHEVAKGLLWI